MELAAKLWLCFKYIIPQLTMNANMKYTVVVLLTDQEGSYLGVGKALTPWEAIGVAWREVAAQMQIPVQPPKAATSTGSGQAQNGHQEPKQTPPPAQPPPPSPPPQSPPTPNETAKWKCPIRGLSRPSRYGGLHCPVQTGTDEEGFAVFCNEKWAPPKRKKESPSGRG
jgi:hypothetical protein